MQYEARPVLAASEAVLESLAGVRHIRQAASSARVYQAIIAYQRLKIIYDFSQIVNISK